MTLLALVVLGLAAEGGDPCAAGAEPAGAAPDPGTAALYRAVGDEEVQADHLQAAKVAYARALQWNSADRQAQAGLAALCSPKPATGSLEALAVDEFQVGVDRMARGDRAGAIAAFERVRSRGVDRAASLLEGICLYEEEQDAQARPLLEEARSEPKLAGTATVFLGLIALRQDDPARALGLFDAARAADARLTSSLFGLSRAASQEGRLLFSALTEAGYDSNVSLVPDGTATAGGAGDGYGLATVGLFGRPFGAQGPFGRVIGQYRKQLQITTYDLGDVGAAGGYRLGRATRFLAAEYGYDFLTLGGTEYLSAEHVAAEGRLARGALALHGGYTGRWESFLTSNTSPYSGFAQEAEVEAAWQGPLVGAALGYQFTADHARDSALAFTENGARATLTMGAAGDTRAAITGAFTARRYDAVDPDLAVERSDRYLDLVIGAERDVSVHWTARLTLTARRAFSNVPEFEYTKLTAAIGLAYSGGVL